MIDWVSAKLPFHYPEIIENSRIEEVFRKTGEIKYSISTRLSVKGSFESAVMIRTSKAHNGQTIEIEFSGNPVKFLQGHNVYGSDNLLALMYQTVLKLSQALPAPQPSEVLHAIACGHYTLSRVDINESYSLPSRASVLAHLHELSCSSRTRSQTAITSGSTVYWNKSSKRWTMKAYSKGQEITLARNKKHVTPQQLIDLSDNLLRIELTLKSRQLITENLQNAYKWLKLNTKFILNSYQKRLNMTINSNADSILDSIPSLTTKGIYSVWKSGKDPRQGISNATYYRHRSALLAHGVDISIPCKTPNETSPSNVVHLIHPAEWIPFDFSEYMKDERYYFHPTIPEHHRPALHAVK